MQKYKDNSFLLVTIFLTSVLCNVDAISFLHDGYGGWKQGGFKHNNNIHPPRNAHMFGAGDFDEIETYRVIHEAFGQSYENENKHTVVPQNQRTVKFLHNDIPSYDKLPAHGDVNHVQIVKNGPVGKPHFYTIKVIHEIASPAFDNNIHTVSQLHTKVSSPNSIKQNYWSRPAQFLSKEDFSFKK